MSGRALDVATGPDGSDVPSSGGPSFDGATAVFVNGEAAELERGSTVADLLARRALVGKRVAVERNGMIVPRSQHAATTLAAGDRIEIVVAVGGG